MKRAQCLKLKCVVQLLLLAGAILLLTGAAAYLCRDQLLTGLAGYLVIDDQLQPADLIFVLSGEVDTRPFRAAELFQQGLAPRIVVARAEDSPAAELGLYPNVSDVTVEILQELGVPEENISLLQVEGGATSTRDEAIILRGYLEHHSFERVILVTSAFHTRRARWIFERELAPSHISLQLAAAPHRKYDVTTWWQEETDLIDFTNEYIKLGYYFLRYS
jgi:uncharacterized SAM-binding protein YcdF (DUF218 family)